MLLRKSQNIKWVFALGVLLLISTAFLNLILGSVDIPGMEVLKVLSGQRASKSTWHYIILDFRLPKTITAILVGGALALSGLLMQSLFRNPLAGPFVLGISSGANVMVALAIMVSSVLPFIHMDPTNPLALSIAAILGALGVMFVILGVSLKIKDNNALLIVGIMIGSISSAVISVLQYFSEAAEVKMFLFWNFGSLAGLSWTQLGILAVICIPAMVASFLLLKPLNVWLMGDGYARSLGVHAGRLKIKLILLAGILAGIVTGLVGPIAFVGIAVPHLVRLATGTVNHKILIPAVVLTGALFMLVCDTISQVPSAALVLPINAITSAFGAPVVIWIIISKGNVRGGIFK